MDGSDHKYAVHVYIDEGKKGREGRRKIQLDLKITAETVCPHHFLDFSLGGGFRGIRNKARIGCMSHNAEGKSTEIKHADK